uniref:Uncharacterized protein n=1 Tax=Rhizophora mucronata TaxID=61149 RepID=A0A2P2IHA0_RHIMU
MQRVSGIRWALRAGYRVTTGSSLDSEVTRIATVTTEVTMTTGILWLWVGCLTPTTILYRAIFRSCNGGPSQCQLYEQQQRFLRKSRKVQAYGILNRYRVVSMETEYVHIYICKLEKQKVKPRTNSWVLIQTDFAFLFFSYFFNTVLKEFLELTWKLKARI